MDLLPMKDDSAMVYFWELERYAQLNKPGTKARLTKAGYMAIKWYGIVLKTPMTKRISYI